MNKTCVILGGGTFSHVRTHLSLATPAFGTTARHLEVLAKEKFKNMDVKLHLTRMADPSSNLVTNDDINIIVTDIINDNTIKVVFFNVALCDYVGKVGDIFSSKYADRLQTKNGNQIMELTPAFKIIKRIRQHRKDIFLIGFKTTAGAEPADQFAAGLNLMKTTSCNLVLANDVITHKNMIITPEEGAYGKDLDRADALRELVDIAYWRTHLTFTRSTVVDGQPVGWNSWEVPAALRTVIDHCVERGAYKTFNGVTTGHFAVKLGPGEFLTSIRKTNFNDIDKNGLVRVKTDGDDNVIAYGSKPSVGGQSQRIIFNTFQDCDCIVHFHCPLKTDSKVTSVSQREYECGSHQCGENTARGLNYYGDGIYAVMLDNHGPNIVFNRYADPQKVIDFIEEHFDLEGSTSGFSQVYMDIAS